LQEVISCRIIEKGKYESGIIKRLGIKLPDDLPLCIDDAKSSLPGLCVGETIDVEEVRSGVGVYFQVDFFFELCRGSVELASGYEASVFV